jgi:monoamine oxidase
LESHDVVVIGGGIAGVTAARDMGGDGLSVLLLEARNRLGGRTYYRRFADTEYAVEFGGAWIAPRWQRYVAREVERYNLSFTESPEHTSFASLVGGMTLNQFVPRGEEADRDRAINYITRTSRRLDPLTPLAEPDVELDVPLTAFLREVRLPEATRDHMMAWLSSAFGCEPDEVSALNALSLAAAHGHDARAWYEGESEVLKFADGTGSLVEAMIEDSGADMRTSSPVRRVEQNGRGVVVTTQAGDAFSASAAVVALPLNVLKHVDFAPKLGEEKRIASEEGHAGRSVKVWALVEGAPPFFEGVGQGPKGLKWIGTEHEFPEGSLMVGFGSEPEALDAKSISEVQDAFAAFVPDARVLKVDAHDWNSDPYSLGSWMAFRPGQITRLGAGLRRPEGRLAFATADMAIGWTGYIDGAIESGSRAAERTRELLDARVRENSSRDYGR